MSKKIVKEFEFWISNISDRNVSITDLALTIDARRSVNLLDKKHYSYTKEVLEASAKSGSLFKKSHILKVRQVAPDPIAVKPGIYISKMPRGLAQNQKLRSQVIVEEPQYKELQVTEESFAEQMTKDE